MQHLGKRTTTIFAAVAIGMASLAVAAPAAQADAPSYYPSGIQTDVPISTITGGGWSLCFEGLYAEIETLTDIMSNCSGDQLLLAAGVVGEPNYILAAAGDRSAVFGVTGYNETTLNNGTYFYFNPTQSMGFSPIADIQQGSADVYDGWTPGPTGPYRLSWHLDACYDWDSPCVPNGQPGYMNGGWRAGQNTSLNDSTDYVRAIYQKTVYRQPQLVVDALNVRTTMGQPVPQDYRVLGLVGSDKVTDVVLEYDGTNIWGEHVGPTTTPPTQAGTYTVSVKSYKLTAADASIYWQTKHTATLTVLWAPLPITDPALVGSANAPSAAAPNYAKTGATASGSGWSVSVNGAPASAAGGFLITDPGASLSVTGKGFKPYSAVRIYFMSDPVELGSVWTDANGSFAKSVTVPATASGSHTLQVNGYAADGKVRTVNVALVVGSTHLLSQTLLFDPRSAELKSSIAARIQMMLMAVPAAPWTVHLTVATSSAGDAKSAKLAQERIDVVVSRLQSSLEAAGITVVVETTVWDQPGLKTSNPRQLRVVYVDLNW